MKTKERRLIYQLATSAAGSSYLAEYSKKIQKGILAKENMNFLIVHFLERLYSFIEGQLKEVDSNRDLEIAAMSYFRTGYIDGYVEVKKQSKIFQKLFNDIWSEVPEEVENVPVITSRA